MRGSGRTAAGARGRRVTGDPGLLGRRLPSPRVGRPRTEPRRSAAGPGTGRDRQPEPVTQGVDLLGDEALDGGGAGDVVEDHNPVSRRPSRLGAHRSGPSGPGSDWWYESSLTRSSRISSPRRPNTPERSTIRVVVTTRLVVNQRTQPPRQPQRRDGHEGEQHVADPDGSVGECTTTAMTRATTATARPRGASPGTPSAAGARRRPPRPRSGAGGEKACHASVSPRLPPGAC